MMQKRWIFILFSVVIMVMSACSQEDALPTAMSIPTDAPATEEPQAQEVEPTATKTPAPPSTLPPTWTFTPEVTETIIPTETEISETVTPMPTPKAVSSVCDTFQADSERSTREFVAGDTPVAAWTPVEGAVLYRVFLYNFNGKTMRDDIYTDQTSWEFDPNVFEFGENYVWAVWPLDVIGDQMCFERGLELIPLRPPVNSGG